MPQYELKEPYFQDNGSLKDNGNETSSQPIIITVGIVGDTYGFIPKDPSKLMTTVNLPNKAKDLDELRLICLQAADALRIKNFPDT